MTTKTDAINRLQDLLGDGGSRELAVLIWERHGEAALSESFDLIKAAADLCIKASELLALPSEALPGAHMEDASASIAWEQVEALTHHDDLYFCAVYATSSRWSGEKIVIEG